MSVSGISQNNYALQFWQKQQDQADGTKTRTWNSAASSQGAGSSSGNTLSAYSGTSLISHLETSIKSAMSALGLKEGDRVTFATLAEAHKKQEQQFAEDIKKELNKLDIDEDIEFSLISDSKGGITVVSDHEDKAKIEKFFKDNPKMVEKFNEIQAMTNLEEARKNQRIDPQEMRRRIQMESLVSWFSGTGQSVDQLMMHSGGQSAFSPTGINRTA